VCWKSDECVGKLEDIFTVQLLVSISLSIDIFMAIIFNIVYAWETVGFVAINWLRVFEPLLFNQRFDLMTRTRKL
jgi:hypothetical protein